MKKMKMHVTTASHERMMELDRFLFAIALLGICPVDYWSQTSIEWLRQTAEGAQS